MVGIRREELPRSGSLREGFPEIMGMTEVVAASKRGSPAAVRYYVDNDPAFPEPVANLAAGAFYLASEIRSYWASNPARTRLTDEARIWIKREAAKGVPQKDLAEIFGVSTQTISRVVNDVSRSKRKK